MWRYVANSGDEQLIRSILDTNSTREELLAVADSLVLIAR